MKKTVIALSLVAASSWIAAGDLTTSGKTTLQTAQCGVIAENQTATINLSTGVSGAYECNTTNAGVATRHAQGAGKTYSASSNGGKLSETTDTVTAAAAAARDAS